VVRVVRVSDSHLSPEAPYADAHWLSVVDHVAIGDHLASPYDH
jgi:hypothetical protein